MVNNPFLTVILGDLNAKLSFWYNNDELHMKDPKLMVQPPNLDYHKFTQIIGYSSLCLDLIFTTQANIVMESEFILRNTKLSSPYKVGEIQS